MFLAKKFLSAWLLPPFGLILIAILLLCFGRRRRVAVGLAVGLLAITFALSLPIVANEVARTLEDYPPISSNDLASGQAIVILGGGIYRGVAEYGGDTLSQFSLERVRYGATLARASKAPVLVTGGVVYDGDPEAELMKHVLESEFSVPVRWQEIGSRNTDENARYAAGILKNENIHRIVLVTHAWHMPRAKPLFEAYGVTVIPAPMGFAPREASMFERLLPSLGSFTRSAVCLREWVARLVS